MIRAAASPGRFANIQFQAMAPSPDSRWTGRMRLRRPPARIPCSMLLETTISRRITQGGMARLGRHRLWRHVITIISTGVVTLERKYVGDIRSCPLPCSSPALNRRSQISQATSTSCQTVPSILDEVVGADLGGQDRRAGRAAAAALVIAGGVV